MKVEFLYFDLHGIGIIPRLAMAAGGIKFEDTRVTFPEGWPELKKSKLSRIFYCSLNFSSFATWTSTSAQNERARHKSV